MLLSRRKYVLQNDDAGNNGGGGPAQKPAPNPEVFSREYVQELRHESAGYRARATEAEKKALEAEDRAKKAAEDADAKVQASDQKATERIIRAEVKALAVKEGIVDLDALKLADFTGVKINDQGEVEGGEAVIETLKKSKPYLFAKTTSSTELPPKPHDKTSARDKSPEEKTKDLQTKFGLRV